MGEIVLDGRARIEREDAERSALYEKVNAGCEEEEGDDN